MKRWLAALIALLLIHTCALAQDRPIALYELPDGAQVRFLSEAGDLVIPEGMEALYTLMNNATWEGNVYLIRMKNGYGMASVSCREMDRSLTAEELLELWPRIMASIAREAQAVDEEGVYASAEECFGHPMLHVRVPMTLYGGLRVDAEGFAFMRGNEITEVWSAIPQEETFAEDQPEHALLQSDREDLSFFVQSLDFPDGTEWIVDGRPYEAGDGSYRLMIPADAVVLTVKTPTDEVAAVRERFIELNPEGASSVFDAMMSNMYQTGATFIFTEDMQGAMELFSAREEGLKGATPEGLSRLAPIIEDSLKERYELAVCMDPDARTIIDSREHALMGYWLRQGDMDVQLDLMVCVHEDNWMYEVDVFSAEGNQEVRALLHAYVAQTLQYTPPVNGLE